LFIKRIQFVLILISIMMMLLPNKQATASVPLLQQDMIIAYHPLTGRVRFMGAQSGKPILKATALQNKATPESAALSFLTLRGYEFGLVDAKNNLRVLRQTQAGNGTSTERFQQTYQGIPILAGEIIVHLDSLRNILSVSGDILPNIALDITPDVDEATAIKIALEETAKENGINGIDLQASTPELWLYNPALLSPYNGKTVLTWRVEVIPKTDLTPIRQLVLVEAKRGAIVLSFNQVDYSKNRFTFDAAGTNSLPGTLICNESNPTCDGGSTDAVTAHLYAVRHMIFT
jgi:Zn-dependent metalloprotease